MYQFYIKRILDVILSILLIPIVILVFPCIFLLIKLEDRGPIFYLDTRYSRNMKVFKMYKFRTMEVNAPDIRNDDGTTFNSESDSRITKVGKILRKTSIDELPQLLNVLKGDMSFVGPRPSPLGDKSMYPQKYYDKFKVRPGITGYSQAYYRNSISIYDRIENDSYYVANVSFIFDIKILVQTFKAVLGRKGIYRN